MDAIELTEKTTETTTETTAVENAVCALADLDALAASLAQAAPSAGALGELEFERLSPAGRINAVLGWERLVRHAHAGLIRCLGTLARDAGDPRRITQDGADSRWLIES